MLEFFGDIPGVHVVFDDIIIAGETKAEHDKILKEVLEAAQSNNVKFNKQKIQLKIKSVKYIDYRLIWMIKITFEFPFVKILYLTIFLERRNSSSTVTSKYPPTKHNTHR